jgi:hypothetical protein
VTVLRDLVERVFSLYSYLKLKEVFTQSTQLEDFVVGDVEAAWNANLLAWHPEPPPHSEGAMRTLSKAIADNDQTRRIAGASPLFGRCDESTFEKARLNLESHFSVVGLTERFDETLVLLKRRLGWDEVPRYLPRLINSGKPPLVEVPRRVIRLVAGQNAFDQRLYDFARSVFDRQVEDSGPDFAEEVREFRSRNAERQKRYASAVADLGLA